MYETGTKTVDEMITALQCLSDLGAGGHPIVVSAPPPNDTLIEGIPLVMGPPVIMRCESTLLLHDPNVAMADCKGHVCVLLIRGMPELMPTVPSIRPSSTLTVLGVSSGACTDALISIEVARGRGVFDDEQIRRLTPLVLGLRDHADGLIEESTADKAPSL